MPQQIQWYEPNRIIHHRFYGVVTLEDITQGNEQAIALIRQGTPPVHDIVDAVDVERVLFNLNGLLHSTSFFKEPNLGWMIVAAENPMVRFFGSMLGQVTHTRFRTVDNLEEALETLTHVDMTLQRLMTLEIPIR
jgi:hypothetical protein